jgi:hypothetical protein
MIRPGLEPIPAPLHGFLYYFIRVDMGGLCGAPAIELSLPLLTVDTDTPFPGAPFGSGEHLASPVIDMATYDNYHELNGRPNQNRSVPD